ncbi:MAG: hypothetical protein LAQ30_30230, partial [Acidobacteriia bacterium]|nr:hypothetical protein [Terriglobia bacterium]
AGAAASASIQRHFPAKPIYGSFPVTSTLYSTTRQGRSVAHSGSLASLEPGVGTIADTAGRSAHATVA